MSLGAGDIVAAAAIGFGATLGMDLWNLLLKRAFGIPSLNYCLLGRWLCHMPRRTFRHASIAAAAPMRFECAAGWIAHYSIGLGIASSRAPNPAEARLKSLATHTVFGVGLYLSALVVSQVRQLLP